jgi:hypothetical protein
MAASADRVRAVMFDPRQDPGWMAAVRSVEPLGNETVPGARVRPSGTGSYVTIRNTGEAPALAPRWFLRIAMRRSLAADLRRLKHVVEGHR